MESQQKMKSDKENTIPVPLPPAPQQQQTPGMLLLPPAQDGDLSPTTPRHRPTPQKAPNAPSRPARHAWSNNNGYNRHHNNNSSSYQRHRPALRLTEVMTEQTEGRNATPTTTANTQRNPTARQPLFSEPLTPPPVADLKYGEPFNVATAFNATFHATRSGIWKSIREAFNDGDTDCDYNIPLEIVSAGVLREIMRFGYGVYLVDQFPAPNSGTGGIGDNRPLKYMCQYRIDWSLLIAPSM
jgi:hypothetical protein